jgi:hypothetical protein
MGAVLLNDLTDSLGNNVWVLGLVDKRGDGNSCWHVDFTDIHPIRESMNQRAHHLWQLGILSFKDVHLALNFENR